MARVVVHAAVFLLVLHAVKASFGNDLEKKDLKDKWPVLFAILEKLFLPDECIYYTKLSSFERSIDFSDPSTSPLCDAKLEHGWFRFTESAGSRMATSCVLDPNDLHCSSMSPGWMDGEHPSIEDGKVKRKVCFHGNGNCCQASIDIDVRNCGPFFVYHLERVPCPFRYCGSHAAIPTPTPEPLPTEQPSTTLSPFPTFPENVTTEKPSTLPPFPTMNPENATTTAEPTTLPPFPTLPGNVTTEEPSTLPPFPTMKPENASTTAEPSTLLPLPETTRQPTTLLPLPRPKDECWDYKTLAEPSRAISFYDPYMSKGDHELTTGWYRFTDKAGTKMADSCVDVFHCGTNSPGWLLGGHPTNATEHAVWKTACFSWADKCCYFKGHIQVRQCGDFFVYHLRKLRVRYLRYCGNDTVPILNDAN